MHTCQQLMKKSSRRALFTIAALLFVVFAEAQQATWIWYPGDFEIVLSNKVQNRRTERGTFFPVFWKIDNHYVLMDFHKVVDVAAPEEVEIFAEGQYNVKLDGKPFEGSPSKITVPAGKHKINIKVFNQAEVPAVFIKGKTIVSDASWLVTFEDKEWIDETGKTSDISATNWLQAGSWNFNTPAQRPSQFRLPVRPLSAKSVEKVAGGQVIDFGRETFGFVRLHGVKGKGNLSLYYVSPAKRHCPPRIAKRSIVFISMRRNPSIRYLHCQRPSVMCLSRETPALRLIPCPYYTNTPM